MKIEALKIEELEELYETRLREDFPEDELRPYSNMKYLWDLGAYRGFVCRENGGVEAYALFALSEGAALLDYYAVAPSLRGKGVGSRFLSGLKDMFRQRGIPYIIIEAESVESAQTPEQVEERQRRLRFYEHCGCRATEVYSYLFGVEFQILLLPLSQAARPDSREIKAALEGLYRIMIPPMVGRNEKEFRKVCQCYLKADGAGRPRDFARELGRAVTFLYRSRSKFMGERLREYGFSGAMYMMLLHVALHPGATQDSIATHMYIDKSNVARRIKQLEELGYIRRETDLTDRRQNNLYLTERGRELVPVVRTYLSQWGSSVSARLSEQELDALLSLLEKLKTD